MRVREKSTEDDLSHLVTARRKLIEDQMLAGHGRLVAIRRLLDVVEPVADEGELVAADAGHGVGLALEILKAALAHINIAKS